MEERTARRVHVEPMEKWGETVGKLRAILLSCGLTEEWKWGSPCFSLEGKNVALINEFKDSVALLFFKGELMRDPAGILTKTGENARAGRRIVFRDAEAVERTAPLVRSCIEEAIRVEEAGLKSTLPPEEFPIPGEFVDRMKEISGLREAFESLTPGRRRAYLRYFSLPKLPETRLARIDKCIPLIQSGKGLDDGK